MQDYQGIEGIVVVRFWKPEVKNTGIYTGDGLLQNGFKPELEIIRKNTVTDEGLRWLRGQVNKEDKWGSKMGKMTAVCTSPPGDGSDTKTLILSNGVGPYTLVQDSFWDYNELVNKIIIGIQIWTYTDGTTPASAVALQYATVRLDSNDYFLKTNSTTMTITRYETIRNI